MILQPLTLAQKILFSDYFKREHSQLSIYSFNNIFTSAVFYQLRWAIFKERLCIFFMTDHSCFMPLPPLGGLDKEVIDVCFDYMEDINQNRDFSRMEGIEAVQLEFFKKYAFRYFKKSEELIVDRLQIVSLKGERFRHKRSSRNFFIREHHPDLRDYTLRDREAVLALYQKWAGQRNQRHSSSLETKMLKDGFLLLEATLGHRQELDFLAQVIVSNEKVCSFTCGTPLTEDMICINFEFADLSLKGIASYCFVSFAQCLERFSLLNIMDSCGVENLLRAKRSWRPVQEVDSYSILLN